MSNNTGFTPISIDEFVRLSVEDDPAADADSLRAELEEALEARKNGARCECGKPIWVIGSAFAGPICYSCLTGNEAPANDYEIDQAL